VTSQNEALATTVASCTINAMLGTEMRAMSQRRNRRDVFGLSGDTVVRRPEDLPTRLPALYAQLTAT
jgi:hypothetical protein